MKKTKNLCFLVVLFLISGISWSQINQFRKINDKGIANMVFANKTIEKGQESNTSLKNSFAENEAIYARCYFPKPFGEYKATSDEKYYIDLYLDGGFVERLNQSYPDATWQQISLYIINTGDDDFKNLENALINAGSGEHKLKVSVGIERYMKTKEVIQDDGSIKKEKVYNMLYLSDGEITITVK
ncbi:MAG: hypothetical protein ABIJ97_02840 [Bacteroidota bacterium]